MNTNLLITVEGCDGSGKTTAVDFIHQYLVSKDRNPIMLKALGTGIFGQQIRTHFLQGQIPNRLIATACTLAILDCYEIAYEKMDQGYDVIIDRGIASFYAYNVIANKDIGAELLFNDLLLNKVLIPHQSSKTFFIDSLTNTCINRINNRFNTESSIYDVKPPDYFDTVSRAFWDFFTTHLSIDSYIVTNNTTIDNLQQQLIYALDSLLGKEQTNVLTITKSV